MVLPSIQKGNAKTLSSTESAAAHSVTDYYEDEDVYLTSRHCGDTARIPYVLHSYYTTTEVQLAILTSTFVNGSTSTTLAYTSTYIHTSSSTAAGTLQSLLPLANSSTTQLPSNDRCTSHVAAVLVVAIAVPIILITIGLFSFRMIRRRRPRKEEVATSTQDVRKDEGKVVQMYLQQKAELDDEQRRHETEAVEIKHEIEGEHMTH